jgi:hypothetical protein
MTTSAAETLTDRNLAVELVRATEAAAMAASRYPDAETRTRSTVPPWTRSGPF